jgi:hypothetical protein
VKIIYKDTEDSVSFIEVDGLVIAKPDGCNYCSFTYTINGKPYILIPTTADLNEEDYESLTESRINYSKITNLFVEEKIPFTGELMYTCLVGDEKYFDFRLKELKKINPSVHEESKTKEGRVF